MTTTPDDAQTECPFENEECAEDDRCRDCENELALADDYDAHH